MVKLTMNELVSLFDSIEALGRTEDPPRVSGQLWLPLSKVRLARAPRMILAVNSLAWRSHIEPFRAARMKIFEELGPEGFSEDRQKFNIASVPEKKRQAVSDAVAELLRQEIEVQIQQIEMKDFEVPDDIPQAEYELILILFQRVIKDFPTLDQNSQPDNVTSIKKNNVKPKAVATK